MRGPPEEPLSVDPDPPEPPCVGQVYRLRDDDRVTGVWEVLHRNPDAVTAISADGDLRVRVLSSHEWHRRLCP